MFPIAMGSFWFTVLELALASFKITCQGFVSVNIWRSEFDMFMFAGTFRNVVSKWSSTLVGSIAVFASELWKRNLNITNSTFATQRLQIIHLLEPLQFKNRQMKMPTFKLMTNQAVTKAIQMFPPCRLAVLLRSTPVSKRT